MALHVPKAPGVSQMLKEGARVSDLCLPEFNLEPSLDSSHPI